jgi:gamma-glutamyl hercynylcysteine S-oxide hydrolase
VCRHLAYVGEPVRLADLLLTPPHSLLRQSWAPRDMRRGGTVNADGFGVGWYPAEPGANDGPGSASAAPSRLAGEAAAAMGEPSGSTAAEPIRLRRASPMWTDTALPGLAASVTTGAVLAAVRSATVGMPVVETACAPFASGPWLFSHNGLVRGWPSSVAGLASRVPVTDLLTMEAPTDSALLWTLLRALLSDGVPPAKAVASVVTDVAEAAPDSRLNLLLTNGSMIVGTAWTHALWVRALPGAVVAASEPYDDDPGWQEVPDGHLLTATPSTVDITRLGDP